MTDSWPSIQDFLSHISMPGDEVSTARYDLLPVAGWLREINPRFFDPAVVVAGTNGKGSVCWWLSKALEAAGYRTALYTSPHVVDVRERVRLGGVPVSEEVFLRHANAAREAVDRVGPRAGRRPTYFEWITLAAAGCFAEFEPDVHVLEVGMGGRLDAVNAADPFLSVVTNVDVDHQRFLGGTRDEIAREKMGVLRPGRPAVLGPQDEWSAPFAAELAGRAGGVVRARAVYEAEFGPGSGALWELGLAGQFQKFNAATVVAAVREMNAAGWDIPHGALREALSQGGWPGRLEQVGWDPPVVVDGAHNPHAAEQLALHVEQSFSPPPVLVFGAMGDKDIRAMLARLASSAWKVVLTRPSSARAAGPEAYGDVPEIAGAPFFETAREALDVARALAKLGGRAVLVAGSLYLAGEVIQLCSPSLMTSQKVNELTSRVKSTTDSEGFAGGTPALPGLFAEPLFPGGGRT